MSRRLLSSFETLSRWPRPTRQTVSRARGTPVTHTDVPLSPSLVSRQPAERVRQGPTAVRGDLGLGPDQSQRLHGLPVVRDLGAAEGGCRWLVRSPCPRGPCPRGLCPRGPCPRGPCPRAALRVARPAGGAGGDRPRAPGAEMPPPVAVPAGVAHVALALNDKTTKGNRSCRYLKLKSGRFP